MALLASSGPLSEMELAGLSWRATRASSSRATSSPTATYQESSPGTRERKDVAGSGLFAQCRASRAPLADWTINRYAQPDPEDHTSTAIKHGASLLYWRHTPTYE